MMPSMAPTSSLGIPLSRGAIAEVAADAKAMGSMMGDGVSELWEAPTGEIDMDPAVGVMISELAVVSEIEDAICGELDKGVVVEVVILELAVAPEVEDVICEMSS